MVMLPRKVTLHQAPSMPQIVDGWAHYCQTVRWRILPGIYWLFATKRASAHVGKYAG